MGKMKQKFLENTLQPNWGTTKLQNIRRNELRALMFPIYSRASDVYQMDTWEQSDNVKDLHTQLDGRAKQNKEAKSFQKDFNESYVPYFLMLINVNTRKGYYVPMKHKDGATVRAAFIKYVLPNIPNIRQIVSDEDTAYLSAEMQELFKQHNIKHVTTEKYGKHILAPINRFMRTIRDKYPHRRDLSILEMHKAVQEYNAQKHSAIKMAPNDMDTNKEKQYIMDQYQKEQAVKAATLIPSNTPIRIALDQKLFEKRRWNFTQTAYPVERLDGKAYIVKDENGEEQRVPRWKIKVGGMVEAKGTPVIILGWDEDKNMYKVQFDTGHVGYCPIKRLRTEAGEASQLEIDYWKDKPRSELPSAVRAVIKRTRVRFVSRK